jgi:hypothetical protein
MDTRQFLNQAQPQVLQSATILLYINAVFALIGFNAGGVLRLAIIAGAVGGWAIANNKKWGYYVGLAAAILPLAFTALFVLRTGMDFNLVTRILFEVLLVVLLVHPMSRNYVKTWFK